MYKIKTHSGSKKRFKVTKNKKIIRAHANKNHILTKKTRKRKRHLRCACLVDCSNLNQVFRLLPYSL
ncbi:MAG: 50S ribosomal protein L35 [Candidatus Improbicoccus pseudotrichonymphae]|uniref:Large ribosomal subunit protein bL35 n=1 Tax=Candidatus Improbicoccus pseudotrichonymphae TaxID=3033792 RepID=A0AA48HYE9_9FIRM|nr:MAG: 50S ribosomal protein L35 [Candidatus Improbicoccus pseudotrichonymphae]